MFLIAITYILHMFLKILILSGSIKFGKFGEETHENTSWTAATPGSLLGSLDRNVILSIGLIFLISYKIDNRPLNLEKGKMFILMVSWTSALVMTLTLSAIIKFEQTLMVLLTSW